MPEMFTRLCKNLSLDQEVFLRELLARNIDVEIIDPVLGVLKTNLNGHEELFFEKDSSIMPYSVAVIAGDKVLAKKLMESKNISIPKGIHFDSLDPKPIKKAFLSMGRTAVLKPSFGSGGKGVFPNIKTTNELTYAVSELEKSRGRNTKVILEEHFRGKEYRVLLTKNGDYVAAYRDPAHIIGDGKNTVADLVKKENHLRTKVIFTALAEIKLGNEAKRVLKDNDMDIKTVPGNNEKIYLSYVSNNLAGGTFEDCTDSVHPSVIENCKKVLTAFPGLPYAGIDYMTDDIATEQKDYRILEVNTNPNLFAHAAPSHGASRNAAKLIVDLIYPA